MQDDARSRYLVLSGRDVVTIAHETPLAVYIVRRMPIHILGWNQTCNTNAGLPSFLLSFLPPSLCSSPLPSLALHHNRNLSVSSDCTASTHLSINSQMPSTRATLVGTAMNSKVVRVEKPQPAVLIRPVAGLRTQPSNVLYTHNRHTSTSDTLSANCLLKFSTRPLTSRRALQVRLCKYV